MMEYKTHAHKEIDPTGTYLQGYIDISYNELVNKLGEPSDQYDYYKSDAYWLIEFEDGTIATIYNYKDGKNYLGDEGLNVEDIKDWHVGGSKKEVLEMVLDIL